jgi:hypothetical protein
MPYPANISSYTIELEIHSPYMLIPHIFQVVSNGRIGYHPDFDGFYVSTLHNNQLMLIYNLLMYTFVLGNMP